MPRQHDCEAVNLATIFITLSPSALWQSRLSFAAIKSRCMFAKMLVHFVSFCRCMWDNLYANATRCKEIHMYVLWPCISVTKITLPEYVVMYLYCCVCGLEHFSKKLSMVLSCICTRTCMHVSLLSQKPHGPVPHASLLPACEQQELGQHVYHHDPDLRAREGRRRIPIHGVCLPRVLWMKKTNP